MNVESISNEGNPSSIPQSAPLELTTKPNANPPTTSTEITTSFVAPIKISKKSQHEAEISKYTYPIQMNNPIQRDSYTVSTDHCYAKPYNWRPEASFLRPTKTLFIPKHVPSKQNVFNIKEYPGGDKGDIIDVETEVVAPLPVYDTNKAKFLMEECDKLAAQARRNDCDEDWEEKISKINWTASQHRLFNGFVNVLNNFQIAKLAQTAVKNEPVLRRTDIDKAVHRTRRLLASFNFDMKLAQWLHNLLFDNLDLQYLSIYLDILQTLKAKLPTFVEKMIYSTNSTVRHPLNNESLFPLLKQPWDPVAANLMQDKPKKLPGNPIIILVPSSPTMTKRHHKWMNLLSNLGSVVSVPTNFGSAGHRMTMINCIDQMFALTRGKVQEMRENYHGRQIILVGCGSGATLALQVAQVENVLCVVALGFSVLTAEGRRGEPDDSLLELQCPVLFVIGQCASRSLQEDMEELRERMRVETGLIVVGSADNNLKISKKKKRQEGVTQSIVDRCVIDEVGEFISGLVLSPYPPQIRQSPPTIAAVPEPVSTRKKHERKRYNSNTSSLDSEPPSPTPKISRPVGRPPGSKGKSKLETKWAAQIAQGTSHPTVLPSSNSNNTISTNNTSTTPSNTTPNAPLSPSNTSTPNSETSTATESPVPYLEQALRNELVGTGSSTTASSSSTTMKNNNSSNAEKTVKKIKVLKPFSAGSIDGQQRKVELGKQSDIQLPTQQARMQAYNLNRNVMVGGQLSTLLQSGIKTIPPAKHSSSNIKVLENLQLPSTSTTKLMSAVGKTIDLSKLSVINPPATGKSCSGNVVFLPDGKIRSLGGNTVKTSTPLLLPLSPSKVERGIRGKYMTSKRHLVNPRPLKRQPFPNPSSTQHTPIQSTLLPPTNLTTQDIMDLPIIFADDNQLLDSSTPTDLSTTAQLPPKLVTATPPITSKYLLVNKPRTLTNSNPGNFIITSTGGVKRTLPMNVVNKPQPKYTKIILSKKPTDISVNKGFGRIHEALTRTHADLTLKRLDNTSRVTNIEAIDLENEIVATAVPKPHISMPDNRSLQTIVPRKDGYSFHILESMKAEETHDDDDPDYIPPKNFK